VLRLKEEQEEHRTLETLQAKKEEKMKTKNLIVLLMILIVSLPSYAVYHKISELNFSNFGSWMELDDDIAIIGTEEWSLFFVDISNPENPNTIQELMNFNYINNLAIKDQIAYVCDDNGLKLIDYSDINNITLTPYFTSEEVNFVNINQNQAVFAYESGFTILDVSNASIPTEIVNFPTTYSIIRANIIGNNLFLLVEDGFKIYEISQPNNPELIGEYVSDFFELSSFAISENNVYLGDWGGIFKVDISDPANPIYVSENSNFLFPMNISVNNDILTYCDYYYSYVTFDIQDFNTPILLSSYATPREAKHYAIQDDILYLLDWSYGLQVVELDDSSNPFEIYRYWKEFEYVDGLAFDENYMYFAEMHGGLTIYDRNNPVDPIYQTGDEMCTGLVKDGNIIYLTYRTGLYLNVGYKIYDVSDPTSPVLLNSWVKENYNTVKLGDYLIFKTGVYMIQIWDVSDPASPEYVDYLNHSSHIVNFRISNNLLFANINDPYNNINGIEIYDISDLTNIVSIGFVDIDYDIFDLNVFGNFIYAGYYNLSWYGSASGYFIIDISDPSNPEIVNEFYVHSLDNDRGVGFGSICCNLSGNDLVVADNRNNRILTYDATDITNPVLQNEFRWNFQTSSIKFDGGKLVLNNWANGITELDWNNFLSVENVIVLSDKFDLSNHPNPFNPSTTIKFSIQNECEVELTIYNIRGQKIKQLVSNQLSAGHQYISWNGDNESGKPVSSGIYYYQLNVNGKTVATNKCLLLK